MNVWAYVYLETYIHDVEKILDTKFGEIWVCARSLARLGVCRINRRKVRVFISYHDNNELSLVWLSLAKLLPFGKYIRSLWQIDSERVEGSWKIIVS